jgi:hypothetical protein
VDDFEDVVQLCMSLDRAVAIQDEVGHRMFGCLPNLAHRRNGLGASYQIHSI